MSLPDLIANIRHRLTESAYPNEAAVSVSVVLPVLRSLGWDDSDPAQISPEYTVPNGKVDFALFGNGRNPAIFVEVKHTGKTSMGDKQVFEYAYHKGVPICLLTDGKEWSFYYPPGEGEYSERRVRKINFVQRDVGDIVDILTRYLHRERVRTGAARDAVDLDFRDLRARREAERSIPKAWASLVDTPEELLIELLQEQTESMSGVRPSSSAILEYLRALRQDASRPVEKASGRVSRLEAPTQQAPRPDAPSNRKVEFELFGQVHAAKNAARALVTILNRLAERHPDRITDIAARAQGRSRNHIARTPEEIYPKRPDLARAEEFFDGWLVGLNISNRDKMRIIRGACEAAGLKFGKDVVIDLPNA